MKLNDDALPKRSLQAVVCVGRARAASAAGVSPHLAGMTLALTLTLFASGCRLKECPPQRLSFSNIAAQSVPVAPFVVHGRVLSLDSAVALPTARVRLLSIDSSWHDVTADGTFSMRPIAPGAYTIEATAVGFEFAIGRVFVSADSAVSVIAVLERSRPQPVNAVCGERPVVR